MVQQQTSLPPSTTACRGVRQCETSRACENPPPKTSCQEDSPQAIKESLIHEVENKENKTGNEYVPLEPSLWNNCVFNAVEFFDRHFSLSEKFQGDYQSLLDISSVRLSN